MESKRFDDLSKAVATMASRRRVLRGIAGGVIASVTGLIGSRGADAARKRALGEICRKPGDCDASLTCVPADYGRNRCCQAEGNWCNGACCQTLCDGDLGCADAVTNVECYHECVDGLCFHLNNGFNYTVNYSFNNELQCERFCAFEYCAQG